MKNIKKPHVRQKQEPSKNPLYAEQGYIPYVQQDPYQQLMDNMKRRKEYNDSIALALFLRAYGARTRPTAASVSLAWCLERFLLLARSQHNAPTSNGLEPVSGGGVSINHLLLPALLRLIIMTL